MFMSILGLKPIELRTFDRSTKKSDTVSVPVDDSIESFEGSGASLPHGWKAGRRVTGVALAAQLLAVGLLFFPNAHASAQREVVEDSWAQAEADIAEEQPPTPSPPRRSTRAEHRAAMQRELAQQAADAHVIRPGDVRLRLRAPRGMTWLWLGDADMPNLGWRLRAGLTLCAGSCAVSLPQGRIRLGLQPEHGPVAISDPFTVARPGRVQGHYVSRGRRIARIIGLLLLSDLAGVGAAYGVFYGVRGYAGFELGLLAGLAIIVPVHIVGFTRLGHPGMSLEFTPERGH